MGGGSSVSLFSEFFLSCLDLTLSCAAQGLVWDLSDGLYHSSFPKALTKLLGYVLLLGDEPRISVGSCTELKGPPSPAPSSLGFLPHSGSQRPLFLNPLSRKLGFSQSFSLPSCHTVPYDSTHLWGELAREKRKKMVGNSLHSLHSFNHIF